MQYPTPFLPLLCTLHSYFRQPQLGSSSLILWKALGEEIVA